MAGEEFSAAIDEAKKLEKKLTEYAPYNGDVHIERTLDLEPPDYVDLTYSDMLNLYERSQKILSTAGMMGALAAAPGEKAKEAQPTVSTTEVESRLREMTTETLKKAEEVATGPEIEKPAPEIELERQAPEEERKKDMLEEIAIEFESRPATEVEKKEEKPAPEIELELPSEKEKPEIEIEEKEEAARPPVPEEAAPKMEEKRIIVAAVPPALKESPDMAASKRYERLEAQIRAALGEKADEMTLKKKMLDLTKQLFKEKSVMKREEIKQQITILKNMLGGTARPPAAGGKGRVDLTHSRIFETMLSTHQAELAQTKDTMIDSYNRQIASIKGKFYQDIAATDDPSRRKQIFESFVFSITSLVEQLPEVIAKYREFVSKKHSAELEKLRGSLGEDEKGVRASVDGRMEYVKDKYGQEFSSVKGIIAREVDNLVEVAGSEVLKKAGEEKPAAAEARLYEVVKDINETDEGTLLYFLHSKDQEFYKRYERKQISKAEAIFKAKELMAKEKGLSDSMVRKYFTHTEG